MTTLPEWANWLARDKDGKLWAFNPKPKVAEDGIWFVPADAYDVECSYIKETDDRYAFIKWEDNNPTSVAEAELRIATKEATGAVKNMGMTFDEAMKRTTELPTAETIWKTKQAVAHGYAETPIIKPTDPVNHPNHYKQGGLETIDIMQALLPHEQFIGYLKGNIIKYRERAEHKGNAEQDYAKAKWYYDKLMEVQHEGN